MSLTPDQNAQLDSLVTDLRTKEDAFGVATDANDAAQSAAQAAVATASGTQQAKASAHDDLGASIDALVAFVQTLKT
jgi:cbb3-type cytochrome oxidase cytochrome c subunit